MNQLTSLIAAHCPGGVEFKPIGEIGELVRGNGMPKSDFSETGTGCIHYGQIYTHYGTWTTETISRVPDEKAAKLAKVDPGDLIITNTSENLDDVCKAVAWLGDEQIVTGGHATVLKHDLDPKYLSYYLQTSHFHAEKKRRATGAKVIDVSAKKLAQISIPVPPIEVQQEIVATLDCFEKLKTELEVELEAEITARLEQYRYYRDELLNFDGQISELTLGDVVVNLDARRRPVKRGDRRSGKFPYYGANGVQDHVDDYIFEGTFLLMGEDGSVTDKHGSPILNWASGKIWVNNHAHVLQPRSEAINLRYLFHYLQTVNISGFVTGETQPKLNQKNMNRIPVVIPAQEEQTRIATLLDKFSKLTTTLSETLPTEVDARRKQYAHYRDQLMDFEKAA